MILAGGGLCLLGMLAIGNNNVTVTEDGVLPGNSPIWKLLFHALPLVIIMLVYVLVLFGTSWTVRFLELHEEGKLFRRPKLMA